MGTELSQSIQETHSRLSENMMLARQDSNISTAALSVADKMFSVYDIASELSRSNTVTSVASVSPKNKRPPRSARGKKNKSPTSKKVIQKIDKLVANLEAKKLVLTDKLQAAHARNSAGAAVKKLNKQIQALNKKIAQMNLKKYNARQHA